MCVPSYSGARADPPEGGARGRLTPCADSAIPGRGFCQITADFELALEGGAVILSGLATPTTGPVSVDDSLLLQPCSYTLTADAILWVYNHESTNWITGAGDLSLSLSVDSCYPDCDGDNVLTFADFGCFQTKFALGDMYADCNADQVLNLADFGCFQTSFALGCP